MAMGARNRKEAVFGKDLESDLYHKRAKGTDGLYCSSNEYFLAFILNEPLLVLGATGHFFLLELCSSFG